MGIRPDLALELIIVPVVDQERAKLFYVDVLGFELRADEESAGYDARLVTVVPPGSRLALMLVPCDDQLPAGSLRGLVLGSNDLAVTVARLRQHAVDTDAPVADGLGRFVVFRDSEGNSWTIREHRPSSVPSAVPTGASTRPEKISPMSREEANTVIDAYLLGDRTDREQVFAQIASLRTDVEAAVPIVRAIALVGARAADESLMALRLSLSSQPASDDSVQIVRKAVADVRKGTAGARERYLAAVGGA